MLARILTHTATALLNATVPPQAPTGSVRIKCRAELPAALVRLANAKPYDTRRTATGLPASAR